MDAPPDQPLIEGSIEATTYGPPYLSRIEQRSGDTIEIGTNYLDNTGNQSFRIQHKNAQGKPTRSIVFQRDNQNRIVSISDPMGSECERRSGWFPCRQIRIRRLGNLVKVFETFGRATGTYLTNQYFYENGNYPHYLDEDR